MDDTKGMLKRVGDGIAGIRERWYDGDFDDIPVVSAAETVAGRAKAASTSAFDLASRIRRGYDGGDLWDLGNRLVLRIADLLDETLRCGSCRQIVVGGMPVDRHEIETARDIMRAYASYTYVDLELWTSRPFASAEGRELLTDAGKALEAAFHESWCDVGEMLFAGDMPRSDARPTRLGAFAARIRNAPCARDLRATRIVELRRLYEVLRAFCERDHGYPDSYATDERYTHIVAWSDDWKDDNVPLDVRFWGNGEVIKGNRPVSEIGADYVLYIGDILEAAKSIEMWTEWIEGEDKGFDASEPTRAALGMLAETGDSADAIVLGEIEDRLRNDFLEVWEWLGRNILELWL